MTKHEIFEQGPYRFSNKFADVTTFTDEELQGRVVEPTFKAQLLAMKAVLYPVITTLFEGKESLVDGRRRVLNARTLVEEGHSEFRLVQVKMFYDIDPNDKAVWAIILNEQRSENDILTWAMVRDLEKAGKWSEIMELHRLNKGRFKKFETLRNLEHPDIWLAAFAKGGVTQNTILAVAKSPRQPFLEEQLTAKGGKLSQADVAASKQVPVAAAVATMPTMLQVPAVNANGNKPIFIAMITKTFEVIAAGHSLGDTLAAKRAYNGEGCDLYQLKKLT